jgi:hypothetical protein
VVADKAQTYGPRLEGLAAWFLSKASYPELMNSLIKKISESILAERS